MTELQTRLQGLSPERRRLMELRMRAAEPRAAGPVLAARPRPGGAAPLSHAQRQLWVLERMQPGTALYAVARPLLVQGPLDAAALERALDALRARHEALRTTFAEREGGPVQRVHPPVPVPLAVDDLSALPAEAREAETRRRVDADANTGFDLEAGPVFRARLLRLAEEEHVLLLCMHHIVSDGWSLGVLQHELGALYAAFVDGRPDPLAPLPLQYADFALWQDEWLRGERLERHLAFWRRALEGAPPALELPTDRPRPAVESHRGESARFNVSPELAERLRALGRAEGATLFHVLLAGLRLVLSRHAGQDEVVIGTPVANRGRTEVEPLIGFFVNMLPLLTAAPGDPTFRALVAAERETALAAFGHQELPFDRLVEELRLPRDPGRNPVFQAVMTLQNARMELPELPGCQVTPLFPRMESSQFDLVFDCYEADDGCLRLEVGWASDLFDPSTVHRIAGHWLQLLENAAAAPETRRSALAMDDAEERAFVVEACNRTRTAYDRDATVHRLFERRAAETPNAVAVEFGETRLTYAALDARAGRLARRLAAAGAGPETRVGVAMVRSVELVVALVAVLKTGAAYLPLDAEYPADRLAFMVADSGLSVLVVADELPAALAGFAGTVVRAGAGFDEPGEEGEPFVSADVGALDLAYVTYTSGSTGTPKAVMMPHRGVIRLVRGTDYAELDAGETFLQLAPMAFDPSLLEIWGALTNGGRLVVAPPHQPTLREIGALIEEKGVSTLWLSTGLFHRMVDEELEPLGRLRHLLAGGDVLSVAHVGRMVEAHPHVRMINGYGPTENATFSCCHTVEPEDAAGPSLPVGRPVARSRVSIPIGRPIANSTAYVVDRAGRPCPLGVPGELYAGGDGVARGYLGRPGLTAERFVPDPFAGEPGARLYRTGDRVRRRENGTLEFLGRIDQQVKVRGFRVEPGEVEAALKAHPTVGDAVVAARADGGAEKRLVAYVVARNGVAPDPAELRAMLAARLPAHLVPSAFVVLEAIPLTPNGKIDRRALPAPEAGAEAHAEPRTPAEEMLAGIFATLLGVERVGAGDDFFRLGGHSLLATQLASRIRRAFGVEVALRTVFEAPTVRALGAHLAAAAAGAPEPLPPLAPLPRGGALPLSFAQERLWFLESLLPGRGLYNMPVRHRLEGPVDADALRRALTAVVARHEALRARYHALDGAPVQEVVAPWPLDLPVADVADDAEEAAWLAAEAWRPFDLERGPLVRAALLRRPEGAHVLALNVHHSAGDGWSWGLLLRDLSDAYAAALRGDDPQLPTPPLQYADFAAWQRGWLAGERLEAQLAYWRGALEGAPALLELPTDRPRPPVPANRGAFFPFALSPGLTRRVHALAAREGATLFMTLLAAFQAVLARWSGQRDVVVGSPIAGRHHGETEEIAGFFVNTLPLRTRLEDDPTFRGLLAQVRRATLDAYAHQDLPFERMVEELRVERSMSHAPVFQVLFGLQNMPPAELRLQGVRAEELEVSPRAAKFDLSVELREAEGRVTGGIEYDADLFDAATVERLAGHFRILLEDVCADPDAHPLQADLLTEADRERLAAWSVGEHVAGAFTAVPHAFAARAAARPEAPAIRFHGGTTTFAELDARASQVARRLRALGAGPETRVGVCLARTPDSIAALLGVMKAGAAYVPLDPNHPPARLATVLADADAVAVVTAPELAERLPADLPLVVLDARETADEGAAEDAAVSIDPTSLACVLYTSGSTGTPKGVMIEHGAVASLLRWLDRLYPGEERAVVLASTSYSFDVSVAEVWGTLCAGGSLVLVENAIELAEVPAAEGVRSACMVPTAAAELLRMGALPPTLRALNLGGEPVTAALTGQLLGAGTVETVRNFYGPTETTVYATWAEARQGDGRPPIGRPVGGARSYVLDPWLRPVPPGLPGELYLGGAGVSRGYVGRPALTAGRFVPDPFSTVPGARMYRTGDRVYWKESAEVRECGSALDPREGQRTPALPHFRTAVLEYLGRLDTQVKLRGFRIELGEVESALLAHPGVAEAVAVVRTDGGDPRLVAYLVLADGHAPPHAGELRAHLRERLPDYMVPGVFVTMDALPLTTSGKVDRRALPEPAATPSAEPDRAPTPTEAELAAVWRDLLGVPRVGAEDSFFALGGHSLLAMRMVSEVNERLGVSLRLRDIFDAPRLADLAAHVDRVREPSLDELLGELGLSEEDALAMLEGAVATRAGGAEHQVAPLVPVERGRTLPLSFAQQRFWFLERLGAAPTAYNVPLVLRLRGVLSADALRRALDGVVARHEALRTVFPTEAGGPVQQVLPALSIPLPVDDLSVLQEGERGAREKEISDAESRFAFDLETGPLLRARLLKLADDEHLLLLTLHHGVVDAWSVGILYRELAALYAAELDGQDAGLPPLPVQYADYAVWQRERLDGAALEGELAYWRERLEGTATLALPTDRPHPAVQSFRGGMHPFALPRESWDAATALARRSGATPFMVLLAAFDALLYRWSGTEDVVVGFPVAGRTPEQTEPLIGVFLNTLALRTDLSGDPTFAGLLARVREVTLDAYAHQEVPFERLVEELKLERSLARHPLFQVMFTFETSLPEAPSLPGVTVELGVGDSGTAKVDLAVAMVEAGGAVRGVFQYAADLWDAETIRRMAGHFARLIEAAAANPDLRVSGLPLLSVEEEDLVLRAWNRTEAERDPVTVHAMFEARAARTPDAPAVVTDDEALTYGELDARANRLAHRLRALGVGAEDRVAILLERSAALAAAELAVMKAGGAFLPLDPAAPAERIAWMLDDSGAAALLTRAAHRDRLGSIAIPMVALDAEAEALAAEPAERVGAAVDPDRLAYVVYTSGSTGTPKGVAIPHRGLANLLAWYGSTFHQGSTSDTVTAASPSFDASVWETWSALASGGTLHVPSDAARTDPAALLAWMERRGVTYAFYPTPIAEALLEALERGAPKPARLWGIGAGGDALRRRAPEGMELLNFYGPTENSVVSTAARVDRDAAGLPPIGRPIENTRAYVLEARLRPAPIGVGGELYVAGEGLARGYLGRPAMTAAAFLPDPFAAAPGARMYRTGDRARWLASGELEFLGRADEQVKVRGHRIEPGEVEAALLAHPAVGQAAVVARGEGAGKQLVGYLEPAPGAAAPGAGELRVWLRERLPDYMVPAAFVTLDALPVSLHGKVDRRRLPAPPEADAGRSYAVPKSGLERKIAEVWREVLNAARVGLDDNFFEIGGHSLLVGRMQERLEAALGAKVLVVDLFLYPTVRTLAEHLTAASASGDAKAGEKAGESAGRGAERREMMGRLRRR